MKITGRTTHAFVELKVDEIQTTIFKSDKAELTEMICNLLELSHELARYTDKSVSDYIDELGL